MDPIDATQSLLRSIGLIPAALLAIALLAGPTTIWLLYRFVVQPRTKRFPTGSGALLWACERCRSANEARISRCYRCGLRRADIVGDLQIFDGDGIVTLAADVEDDWDDDEYDDDEYDTEPLPGVPVMAPLAMPLPRAVAEPPRRMVAVGPGARAAEPSSNGNGVAAHSGNGAAPGELSEFRLGASTQVVGGLRARRLAAAARVADAAVGAPASES